MARTIDVNPDPRYMLQLIAEGYFDRCEHDRWIIVSNPDWDINPHEADPYIVYDTYEDEEYLNDGD